MATMACAQAEEKNKPAITFAEGELEALVKQTPKPIFPDANKIDLEVYMPDNQHVGGILHDKLIEQHDVLHSLESIMTLAKEQLLTLHPDKKIEITNIQL